MASVRAVTAILHSRHGSRAEGTSPAHRARRQAALARRVFHVEDAAEDSSDLMDAAESCESFTAGTRVLLASGVAVPIWCRQPGCTYLTLGPGRRLDLPMLPGCAAAVTIRAARTARPYPGVMSLTVHLPGEVAAALEAEAARRGQTPDRVAADLLAERLPLPGARRRLAFAGVGSSASGRNAADADDMLAEGFGRDC